MAHTASCKPPIRRQLAAPSSAHPRVSADQQPVRNGAQTVIARPIAAYLDERRRRRELLALPAHGGSVLVLDRDAATLCDRRLVAHLAADEPEENATLVCRHYLADAGGRWCRRVQSEDLLIDPLVEDSHGSSTLDRPAADDCDVVDGNGAVYTIDAFSEEGVTAQLRWCRRLSGAGDSVPERVALRHVIAVFESYEPMRSLTERAVARHREDPNLLVTRLRNEYERLCESPVVLNRGLREAVLCAIDQHGLSLGEIAFRCGIVKRDRHGRISGETSWVARRIGLMPEGGETAITPWVHVDVLATIAREGLGISPREVELQ